MSRKNEEPVPSASRTCVHGPDDSWGPERVCHEVPKRLWDDCNCQTSRRVGQTASIPTGLFTTWTRGDSGFPGGTGSGFPSPKSPPRRGVRAGCWRALRHQYPANSPASSERAAPRPAPFHRPEARRNDTDPQQLPPRDPIPAEPNTVRRYCPQRHECPIAPKQGACSLPVARDRIPLNPEA